MRILVFGSSILSSYWNGAATYYRGIYKELHRLGHCITFAEPDAFGRQAHLDAESYPYVRSIVYQPGEYLSVLNSEAEAANILIKHSGIGMDDVALESEIPRFRGNGKSAIFWDVDSPATLSRVENDLSDPFRTCIPEYDAIFSYGGGPAVLDRYYGLGARQCHLIYNALDPDTHFPVEPDAGFICDLLFLGNRLPDRERRVEELFLRAAELAPEMRFVLGGEGWADKTLPGNVRWIGHVPTERHNTLNCSARMVLNINRDSMAQVGFSPPTRVFEVAGSGTCLLCDNWPGVETFFEPCSEILIVRSAEDVARYLRTQRPRELSACGEALRRKVLQNHTYQQRAILTDTILRNLVPGIPASDDARLEAIA